MERYYSKIIGTPVFEDDGRPLTTVKDLVMDPENGILLAFIVNQNKNLIVTALDVISWNDALRINDADSIIPGEDVMRVENVQKRAIKIFKNRVFSKDGQYIGKVFDFSIDSKNMILQKLYVAKDFLGLFRFGSRIIAYKDIVEILPDKIVIKDDLESVKVEESSPINLEDMAVT